MPPPFASSDRREMMAAHAMHAIITASGYMTYMPKPGAVGIDHMDEDWMHRIAEWSVMLADAVLDELDA